MKRVIVYLDETINILVPLYLVAVSIVVVLPTAMDMPNLWLEPEFLPQYFDRHANALIVAPLVLFSFGLLFKHARLYVDAPVGSAPHLVGGIGAVCGLLIPSIMYFTMRLDVFWLNVPSLTAYVLARFHLQSDGEGGWWRRFATFFNSDARLVVATISLYASMFLVMATDIRFDLINQRSEFLADQIERQTKEHIGIYQQQHPCFGNKVTYQSNLIAQMVTLQQPFDTECANNYLTEFALDRFRLLQNENKVLDPAQIQMLTSLLVNYVNRHQGLSGVAQEIRPMFEEGEGLEKFCTADESYCLMKMKKVPGQGQRIEAPAG